MSLSRDPERTREWKRRGARNYEQRLREEGRKFSDLSRNTRLNPVNSERRDREWKRAYGSEERVRWTQRQPCVACGDTPSENAHVAPPGESGGMGRKADARWVVPLCAHCHSVYHSAGRTSFENGNGLDLRKEAERTDREWQEHKASTD